MTNRFTLCTVLAFAFTLAVFRTGHADEPAAQGLFAKKNLVAWCIVPFDSKKRGPEERAAMLEKLGFSKFAYDYRAEHIPTFDAEIEALKRHHIELSAWWFPTTLNDEAKMTLAIFAKHQVTPQLWVTGGGAPTNSPQEQQQRVLAEAARIRPIAEAAAKVNCKVALYNHGGWFGEPDNQIAIIKELNLPNVGIVYNLHHGHEHLANFPDLLQRMKPYLYTFNLNGMVKDGDRKGQKILQLSQGDLDLKLLKVIRDSGYTGPIGILGHTSDDAEQRLQDNLDGLNWLLAQLDGKSPGAAPKMRTPVPVAQAPAAAATPKANVARLTEGKFGKALDGRAGGARISGRDELHALPVTVECWTKLTDKSPYNILVAHELKSSGSHWELFTMAGSGTFTVYTPGYTPDHCHSKAMICDGQWHHVAMILEADRIRLFVDGQQVANQTHQRNEMKPVPGDLALASLVDQQIGCTGLLDEVRISRGARSISAVPHQAFEPDETTVGLWHLDELVENNRFEDATKHSPALVAVSAPAPGPAKSGKIEGHWGEDAIGFRWTEADSRDDRFGQMDTGPFFSGSITGPGGVVFKGIVVRLGPERKEAICYDTELLRASAGWTGFVKFDPARFGIIVPPKIDGPITFTTPLWAGWTRTDQFANFRESNKYGPLPKNMAHYEGLHRNGQRVVLKFLIGSEKSNDAGQDAAGLRTTVLESPWLEESNGISAVSRTLQIGPSSTPLMMLVAQQNAKVRLKAIEKAALLQVGPQNCHVLIVPPRSEPVTVKLLIAAPAVSESDFDKLVAASPAAEDLSLLTKPGSPIWGQPLVTVGEISQREEPLVVDTITPPFQNPYRALIFCGGHDFLPDGRAVVCTMHGDVWLVSGIDASLEKIMWQRFATGLFQPLGIKVAPRPQSAQSPNPVMDVYVVGRDQITRLHDLNNDGEADFYENFNNDAHVSMNGHEYVTCLETDRAGNFYYIKGNFNSATPHDGSLLQVSRDGSRLKVFATGFRNSNGIGMGPHDEITVAPQEGEWTPMSAVFDVHEGGFYGGMMSHHQAVPPTDFQRPICWFPRAADNSSGGQVWIPEDRWGPLAGHLLHMSYGQCKLRLMLQEPLPVDGAKADSEMLRRSPLITMNGGSIELPMTFASGIHRGRFNPNDGHLYLTGLKGWTTSAVKDGCFQRVRYTNRPIDIPVTLQTYRNGIALKFSRPLNREEAEDRESYQLEAWNYHWSATYGSPDKKPSAPSQIGRDPITPKSITLLQDNQTVFLELPDLKPVDQLGINYSMQSADGRPIEQTAYLTLNGIPSQSMSESQIRRSKADAERAELIERLVPGVVLSAPFLPQPVIRRMLAWTDLGATGSDQKVTASGYLKIPANGEYRFNTAAMNAAEIEIQGKKYALGGPDVVVRLRKGVVPFQIQQTVSAKTSGLRMMWESSQFPRESIPASALYHEPFADTLPAENRLQLAGRTLFARHKCGQCHKDDPQRSPELTTGAMLEELRQAPSLENIGSRLEPDWIAEWLRNPSHLRSDATMPRLLAGYDDPALLDLVAYLSSLRDTSAVPPASAPAEDVLAQQNKRGGVLYERIGCIACHTFDPVEANSEWNRISLHFVKGKYRDGQLEQFLLSPGRHHLGSTMPDFRLSKSEAADLAIYLKANAKGVTTRLETPQNGNAARGQKQFAELRCDRCHQISPTSKLAAADVRSAFSGKADQGCLSSQADLARKAPSFHLTDDQRASLSAYLTAVKQGTSIREIKADLKLPMLLSSLRCTACHARDSASALWPEIVSEEGSGKLPDAVPQLTWVGEKLQGPWIEKLLRGEHKQKPRTWITARMPSFPAYAGLIAHRLAEDHGVAFAEPLPTQFDDERVELGRQLTLRDGGLDCRQCHGIGKDLPKGDAATKIALGINFDMTRDRLRPEFALRHLLDPPRYDLGSRMPRFAPDLKTTAIKQIEDGDARRQFEDLKQYLFSLKVED